MATEAPDRWEFARKFVVGLFSREEVKTPLSFYFKALAYFVACLIAVLYAPVGDEMKYRLAIVDAVSVGTIVVIVTLFGWFKPKHLVYGEAGHRAERKMEFGSEKRSFTPAQYALIDNVNDEKQLTEGKD